MLSAADLRDRFPGRLVTVEPLALTHAEGLFEAARGDRELFRWMPLDLSDSYEAVCRWINDSIESGNDVPFAIVEGQTGVPVGSTRFLELRLEHLRVEIGWTWLARRTWGSGANVETKLLLLGHAFERVGLRRVEFKADARNERSRARWRHSAPGSRECCASTSCCETAVRATLRTTRLSMMSGGR